MKNEAKQRTLEEVKESIRASLLARKKSDLRRDALKKIKDESKVEEYVKFDTMPPPVPRNPSGGPTALPPGQVPAQPVPPVQPAMPPPAPAPATPPPAPAH